MTSLFLMLLVIGLAPLASGLVLLRPAPRIVPVLRLGSVLLCALAFNLTFFWQELWLVIPKALTPGLHPTLYHNDHSWRGDRPVAELLQATGALATLVSGLAFLGGLAVTSRASATWRAFLFWMAFQGLSQSLTQLVIGAIVPGNDVGRALAYLGTDAGTKRILLIVAVVLLALAGALLARVYPLGGDGRATALTRAFGLEMLLTTVMATVLIVPFRLPRNLTEVAIVPLLVNLIGAGWLVFGAALVRRKGVNGNDESPRAVAPALALVLALFVFQCILRPGIALG